MDTHKIRGCISRSIFMPEAKVGLGDNIGCFLVICQWKEVVKVQFYRTNARGRSAGRASNNDLRSWNANNERER